MDKWDYFLRDNYLLNIGQKFRYKRFISFCRLESDPEHPRRMRIVFRDTEARDAIRKMIGDRTDLHKNGYQHPVVKVIDRMTVDMWSLAAPYLTVRGRSGSRLGLHEASNDVAAFQRLNEAAIEAKIEDSEEEELEPARRLLRRIWSRDFYSKLYCLDKTDSKCPEHLKNINKNGVLNDLLSVMDEAGGLGGLVADDFTVMETKITTGMTGKDVNSTQFGRKHLIA